MATVEEQLNVANPNTLADANQKVLMGRALRSNAAKSAAGTVGTVTTHVMTLPENAKASGLLSAFASAGAVTGYFTPIGREGAPATTEASITQLGDVIFQATDAVTAAEVTYVPIEGNVIEEVIPVTAAGAGTFLQGRVALLLLEAELLSGSSPGVKVVDFRGAAAGAGEAALTVVGQAAFASADVGASPETANVKYIAQPGAGTGVTDGLQARLDADFLS